MMDGVLRQVSYAARQVRALSVLDGILGERAKGGREGNGRFLCGWFDHDVMQVSQSVAHCCHLTVVIILKPNIRLLPILLCRLPNIRPLP